MFMLPSGHFFIRMRMDYGNAVDYVRMGKKEDIAHICNKEQWEKIPEKFNARFFYHFCKNKHIARNKKRYVHIFNRDKPPVKTISIF